MSDASFTTPPKSFMGCSFMRRESDHGTTRFGLLLIVNDVVLDGVLQGNVAIHQPPELAHNQDGSSGLAVPRAWLAVTGEKLREGGETALAVRTAEMVAHAEEQSAVPGARPTCVIWLGVGPEAAAQVQQGKTLIVASTVFVELEESPAGFENDWLGCSPYVMQRANSLAEGIERFKTSETVTTEEFDNA
jgi:hypothetical protein